MSDCGEAHRDREGAFAAPSVPFYDFDALMHPKRPWWRKLPRYIGVKLGLCRPYRARRPVADSIPIIRAPRGVIAWKASPSQVTVERTISRAEAYVEGIPAGVTSYTRAGETVRIVD